MIEGYTKGIGPGVGEDCQSYMHPPKSNGKLSVYIGCIVCVWVWDCESLWLTLTYNYTVYIIMTVGNNIYDRVLHHMIL